MFLLTAVFPVLVTIAASVVLIVLGIKNVSKVPTTDKTGLIQITATITKINHSIYENGSMYASYIYNGIAYDCKLDFYNSTMHVGDSVKVYINPDKPDTPVSFLYNKIKGILLIVFGSLFGLTMIPIEILINYLVFSGGGL